MFANPILFTTLALHTPSMIQKHYGRERSEIKNMECLVQCVLQVFFPSPRAEVDRFKVYFVFYIEEIRDYAEVSPLMRGFLFSLASVCLHA